jgi:hypothetical protein
MGTFDLVEVKSARLAHVSRWAVRTPTGEYLETSHGKRITFRYDVDARKAGEQRGWALGSVRYLNGNVR